MGVFDPRPDKKFEICPEGKHTGVLFTIVDCGSIRDTYEGQEKIKHQVYLGWELVGVLMEDGRPFMYGNFYNVTDGDYGMYFPKNSNLNKMLRTWTGLNEKQCSYPSLLGKLVKEQTPCSITMAHEPSHKDPEKVYAVAESIKPYKGKDEPAPQNEPLIYALGGDNFEAVPMWLQKKIEACLENNGGVPPRPPKGEDGPVASHNIDEDIPF